MKVLYLMNLDTATEEREILRNPFYGIAMRNFKKQWVNQHSHANKWASPVPILTQMVNQIHIDKIIYGDSHAK